MDIIPSFLFVPIPKAHALPDFERTITTILGVNSTDAINESRKTKTEYGDDALVKYILILRAIGVTPFTSEWSNPFNTQEKMESTDTRVEIAATVWNYISHYHSKILELDQTSSTELRTASTYFAKIEALIKLYESTVARLIHPLFNSKSAAFLQNYQLFIRSTWQLACGQVTADVKDNLLCRIAQRCCVQITALDKELGTYGQEFKSYFKTTTEPVKRYFTALAYFFTGKRYIEAGNHGDAIAALKGAESAIGVVQNDQFIDPQISMAMIMLKTKLHAMCETEVNDNQKIYMMKIPSEIVLETKSVPLVPITPDESIMQLLESDGLKQTYQSLPSMPSYRNTPSTESDVAAAHSPLKRVTSSSPTASPIPPPVFNPSVTDYPQIPSVVGPPIFSPSADKPHVDTPAVPQVQPFHLWSIVKSMKQGVVERLHGISKKPLSEKFTRIVNAYFDHIKVAEANDIVIDNEIKSFASGLFESAAVKEEEINDMIDESLAFYNSLELKLDELEKML